MEDSELELAGLEMEPLELELGPVLGPVTGPVVVGPKRIATLYALMALLPKVHGIVANSVPVTLPSSSRYVAVVVATLFVANGCTQPRVDCHEYSKSLVTVAQVKPMKLFSEGQLAHSTCFPMS
jgi:hypothetical protein